MGVAGKRIAGIALVSITALTGCASIDHPQRAPERMERPERGYAAGYDAGRHALRQSLSKRLRVKSAVTEACPNPGNGLNQDRPPTRSGLRDEISRLRELYRYCARSKDKSDATILWLLGEIRDDG